MTGVRSYLPEGAPGWCYVDNAPIWMARPRWDGFGYEARQYFIRNGHQTPFIGPRLLATSLESARALLPSGLVVETCEHPPGGLAVYAYRAPQ